MCTVTWAHRPEADGYHLGFNRDERHTRGPERAPERALLRGSAYLAPSDGDHGGTWLAVNEHGLTVGLLNGYSASRGPTPAAWTSRGLLVRRVADASDPAQLARVLGQEDLSLFQPFVLLGLAPHAPAAVARWDGLELTWNQDADAERPLASSGHDQPAAQRWRAARLRELELEHDTDDPALLERFLGDHGEGPSYRTPCMHRADAETRSQCRVRVDARSVELVYVAGAPCRTAPDSPRVLARRVASSLA